VAFPKTEGGQGVYSGLTEKSSLFYNDHPGKVLSQAEFRNICKYGRMGKKP
jgi:hypothetical protein